MDPGGHSNILPWIVYGPPIATGLCFVALLIYFRWTLASWIFYQLTVLVSALWTSPIDISEAEDANFWVGLGISITVVTCIVFALNQSLKEEFWKRVTRLVFLANDASHFRIIQHFLRQALQGKLLVIFTKQLTMIMVWFFTPPTVFSDEGLQLLRHVFADRTHPLWATDDPNHMDHEINPRDYQYPSPFLLACDKWILLFMYVCASLYWWASQSGLVSLHAFAAPQAAFEHLIKNSRLRMLLPITAYFRSRHLLAFGLFAAAIGAMRVYTIFNAIGVDLLSLAWLIIIRFPVAILLFGIVCTIPGLLIGGWLQRRLGFSLRSVWLLTTLHVIIVLYSVQAGHQLAANMFTQMLSLQIGQAPNIRATASVSSSHGIYSKLSLLARHIGSGAYHLCSEFVTNGIRRKFDAQTDGVQSRFMSACMLNSPNNMGVCQIVSVAKATCKYSQISEYDASTLCWGKDVINKHFILNLSLSSGIWVRILAAFAAFYLTIVIFHAVYLVYFSSPILRCQWQLGSAQLVNATCTKLPHSFLKLSQVWKRFVEYYTEPRPAEPSQQTDLSADDADRSTSNVFTRLLQPLLATGSRYLRSLPADGMNLLYELMQANDAIRKVMLDNDGDLEYSVKVQIPVINPTRRTLRLPGAEFQFAAIPKPTDYISKRNSNRRTMDPSSARNVSSMNFAGYSKMSTATFRSPNQKGVCSLVVSAGCYCITWILNAITRLGWDLMACFGVGVPSFAITGVAETFGVDMAGLHYLPYPSLKPFCNIWTTEVHVPPCADSAAPHIVEIEAHIELKIGDILFVLARTLENVPINEQSNILQRVGRQLSQSVLSSTELRDLVDPAWELGGVALVYNHASPFSESLAYRVCIAACTLYSSLSAETVAVTAVNYSASNMAVPPIVVTADDNRNSRWFTVLDRHLTSLPTFSNTISTHGDRILELSRSVQQSLQAFIPQDLAEHDNELAELCQLADQRIKRIQIAISQFSDLAANRQHVLTLWHLQEIILTAFFAWIPISLIKAHLSKVERENTASSSTGYAAANKAFQSYFKMLAVQVIKFAYTLCWMQFSFSFGQDTVGSTNTFLDSNSPIHAMITTIITVALDTLCFSDTDDVSSTEPNIHFASNCLSNASETENTIHGLDDCETNNGQHHSLHDHSSNMNRFSVVASAPQWVDDNTDHLENHIRHRNIS